MKINLGYITFPSKKEAKDTILELLRKKLIVCGNILGGAESYFIWDGEVQQSAETVAIIKTRQKNQDKIIKTVRCMHSYECPCVVFLPIEYGDPEFLEWVDAGC